VLSARQRHVGLGLAALLVLGLVIMPIGTLTALIAVATAAYLAVLVDRLRMFWRSLGHADTLVISDAEARAIPDAELPHYTILVPAYREPEVIGPLLDSLSRIEYPTDRLHVQLLFEADDGETIAAARKAAPGSCVEMVLVPPSEPRTKPKACNVGLARACGRFITIYDAEDRPDPLQLRRAVVAFRQLPEQVACLQAKLSYHNADQNLLTRWFTAEYALWFGQLLPALVSRDAPLPLGGTSNHFRRKVLVELGGWDAFNVTEDADLGIRLHRRGYRTRVLESTTLEEANSDAVNWVKQRSRWYKGYLQTWLLHVRQPRLLLSELGLGGFVSFNLFVGGTPLLAIVNPMFWGLTASWFLGRPAFIESLFPAWLYYVSLVCLALGNFTFLYTSLVSARALGHPSLVLAAILSPFYWILMSIAALKALVQLIVAPSFWEKTVHGLDRVPAVTHGRRAGA